MKKLLAVITAVIILCLSCFAAVAAQATHDENKSSLEDYSGQGYLKHNTESIFSFDDETKMYSNYFGMADTSDKMEGSASYSVSFSSAQNQAVAFSTTERAFNLSITDKLTQTVKMWVYVNDVNLIACDHDSVYDTPQANCGTLWIEFAKDSGKTHKYVIQHTFQGSGWHLMEISFNTDNVTYETRQKMDLTDMQWMRVRANVKDGLILKFDGLTKYTYTNEGYTQPECPNNGRWISTCDFDSLDGSIVTEWLASSFETEEKTQGSSSVSITAHKEHVDFRCVWGGLDVPLNQNTDIWHIEIYISDVSAMSDNMEIRLSQSESGDGYAYFEIGYAVMNRLANGGEGFKNGWNTVEVPLMLAKRNIDTEYYGSGMSFRLEHLVIFWEGASEDTEYTLKYDNIYVYSREDSDTDTSSVTSLSGNTSSSEEENSSSFEMSPMVIVAIVLCVAAVAVVVLVVILVIKKNKNNKAGK